VADYDKILLKIFSRRAGAEGAFAKITRGELRRLGVVGHEASHHRAAAACEFVVGYVQIAKHDYRQVRVGLRKLPNPAQDHSRRSPAGAFCLIRAAEF